MHESYARRTRRGKSLPHVSFATKDPRRGLDGRDIRRRVASDSARRSCPGVILDRWCGGRSMEGSPSAAQFPTTCWSRVLAARDRSTPEATEALAELCARYWYPLYAFIRRKGHGPDEAL